MPTASERRASAVARATDRTREWIERRLNDDAEDISRLYRSSRETLKDRLKQIYSGFLKDELDEKSKELVGPSLQQARRTGAYTAIQDAIDREVDALAQSTAQQAIEKLSLRRQQGIARAKRVPVEDLPDETRYVLNELTTTVTGGGTFWDRVDHMSDELKSDVTGQVRRGMLQQETFDDISDRIDKSFGVDKLPDPKGPAYGSVKNYRNEARRQWNLLMADMADEENEGRQDEEATIMVWWAMVGDEATTPGCLARHGFRIEEDLDGDMPPRHINCRCTVAVFDAGTDLTVFQDDAEAELTAQGYTRRRAENED